MPALKLQAVASFRTFLLNSNCRLCACWVQSRMSSARTVSWGWEIFTARAIPHLLQDSLFWQPYISICTVIFILAMLVAIEDASHCHVHSLKSKAYLEPAGFILTYSLASDFRRRAGTSLVSAQIDISMAIVSELTSSELRTWLLCKQRSQHAEPILYANTAIKDSFWYQCKASQSYVKVAIFSKTRR